MDCRAPALPLGVYYTGVLMDAACHLLDINTIVVVQPDPYFEPFREVLTFSETDFLNDDIIITIQVHVCIRESVDSLCRDGADTPMPPYIGKAFTRTNFEDLSLFRYMIMVCE